MDSNRVSKRILPPAPNPCGSCPYRRDVPSGVWARQEYEKLPLYDRETQDQPLGVFLCHQQDGRACAGWTAVHDMYNCLGLRMAASMGMIRDQDMPAFLTYSTGVPLFSSGAEAAEHGCAAIDNPGPDSVRVVSNLLKKKRAR